MTDGGFDPAVLELLRAEREVTIVTAAADGRPHRAIIWVVVDGRDRVLVRSWRGARARWYREAVGRSTVELEVGGRSVTVMAVIATDAERVHACSAGLEAKYAGDPSTPGMLREAILDTTLELRPA